MSASSIASIRSSEKCAVSCDEARKAAAIEDIATIIDGLELSGDDGLPAHVADMEAYCRACSTRRAV